MVEVKFIDGTPVPDDYLTSVSRLVRVAALAIDLFSEDELEAASRGTSPDARAGEEKRCCVCGEEILDDDESAFGVCADCLDNAQRDPEAFIEQALSEKGYVLRIFAGFGKGHVDTAHPTLEAAITAFAAAPANALPRVLRDGTTVAELDPEAGLAPIFADDEAQRIYRAMFDQGALDQEHSQS